MTSQPSDINYAQQTHQYPPGLVSVDIIPHRLRKDGLQSWAQFKPFPVVLSRANQWLLREAAGLLELWTCETVQFDTPSDGTLASVAESIEKTHSESASCYVRGLRLWLYPHGGTAAHAAGSPQEKVQQKQIGCYNVMPSIEDGLFTTESPDRLDRLICQTNALLAVNPIPVN